MEETLPFPLLGGVPHLPLLTGNPISTISSKLDAPQRFALRESLRNLIASFRLLRADRPVRVLALTSTQMGEGKSTTAALLAQTFADLGQRVLLIDADMRRSSMHKLMGVDNFRGLSNLLTEGHQPLQPLLHQLSPHLSVLPAGPPPPDPAKLLASDRAAQLIAELRQLSDFDLFIFDTPPALTLSDPVVLSEHLDGVLFLVSLGEVNRQLPAQALRRFESGGADVLGLITSMLRLPSGRHDYGYGYGSLDGYAPTSDGVGSGTGASRERQTTPRASKGDPSKALRRGFRRFWRWLDDRGET